MITDEVLRPTQLKVDLQKLLSNYRLLEAHAGVPVMAILKANAYGHGLDEVAQLLERAGCSYFGLAYVEEGIRLREIGVRTPILILGGIIGEQIDLFLKHDLTITASSVDKLKSIDAAAKKRGCMARVHLKIDTGMERIGTHYYNAASLLSAAHQADSVLVEGIYSHLANADELDLSHARLQVQRFTDVLQWYTENEIPRPLTHLANSGALLQLPETHFDMVRAGILLYGVYPSSTIPRTLPVKPALSWHTRVVFFKVVLPGHPVSYGSTWQSEEWTRVVTLPVGYGDGYHRRMSGQAEVIIRGQRYPVVGRICMDQAMVNIGRDEAFNGDAVVLLGSDGESTITVEDLAEWADTIPYEILTSVNTRVSRVFIWPAMEESNALEK